MPDLTYEEIKARFEDAFHPHRGVVEHWDYNHRLRFAVFDDKGNRLAEMPDVLISYVTDEHGLNAVIQSMWNQIRKVKTKG
jgi:hypothetical protein